MGSRLFRPSVEGRVVFSGQPEVDCTSWNVSQHSSCYSYFRFVKVINRLIRPSVRRPPRDGGQPKPRHLADCVAQFSSCWNFSGFVKRKFLLNFERGGVKYDSLRLPPILPCHEPSLPGRVRPPTPLSGGPFFLPTLPTRETLPHHSGNSSLLSRNSPHTPGARRGLRRSSQASPRPGGRFRPPR